MMAGKKAGLGDRMAASASPVDAALDAALDDEGDMGPAPRAAPVEAAKGKPAALVAMNIRMAPDLHRALRKLAIDRGESVNTMLVRAAEKIVARHKPVA